MSPIARVLIGIACGLLAAALWGGGAVVSRYLVTQSLGPVDLALLRYAGCFPVALLVVLVMGQRARLAISSRRLALLLALAGPPYHALVIAGYRYASAGSGALLLTGLLPTVALALGALANRALPSANASAGAGLVMTGLLVLSGGLAGGATVTPLGVLIFASAALMWASLNYLVRRWAVDPLRLTLALALWSPLFLPIYLLVEQPPFPDAPVGDLVLQVVYHGWLVALFATFLFFTAIRLAGPYAAAALQTLSPAFAVAFGALLLGEPVHGAIILGAAVTIAGVLLTIGGPRSVSALRIFVARTVAILRSQTIMSWRSPRSQGAPAPNRVAS
jgi:drug/metabolite transporter (DMT)-like permease